MASCQEPLLKSDDEDDLVFDRTGLLSNKVTVKPDVCQRGHSTGRKMQYARTVNLCLAFFALGLCFAIPTATLNDLQASVGADLADIEFIYTARYSGYVFGSIIGGILFDRYNRQFLLFLSLLATAIGIITMPFCTKVGALMACTAITGITMGFLDTGGNVWCLDLWGKKSAPFMQTLHFCFGLGAFVAPLVAEPFLSPHFGNTTGLVDLSASNATLKNVPHVWFPHQRVKAFTEHNIQRDNALQHINTTTVEDASYEAFPLHKSPRHLYQTNQNVAFQSTDWHTNIRHPAKRHTNLHFLREKENERSLYVRNNTPEAENSENFSNFTDYYSTNNTIISQNISEYFANNSLQEDTTVTQLTMTTLTPTTDSTFSTKVKPKKPHYADGNQLKHEDKWDRTSLKLRNPSDLSKNTKQETINTTTTKMPDMSPDKIHLSNGSLLTSNANTTEATSIKNNNTTVLPSNNSSHHDDRKNGTGDSELPISDSDPAGKSVNFSLATTEFTFPGNNSTVLYATPTQTYVTSVKPNSNTRAVGILLQNNVTTVQPFITQTDNNSAGEESSFMVAPQHISKNINVSRNLQSHGHNETGESPSAKIKSSINHTKENDIFSSWSNANFMSSTTEIANKTEFKQTSLRSAETKGLVSTSPPLIELYDVETVEASNIQIFDNRSLLKKTDKNAISNNSSETDSLDLKETRVIASSTDSSSDTATLGRKNSHVDFLSNLFATMCQHRLGKFEIAYVILGIYIFIVASIFLICLCLNPREPRSRQEEQLDKSKNITATFRISVVILVSLFLCLYVGIEVAVGQLLQTFAVKQYLQLPESTGYFMTYSFWGSFALSRGISIALSIKFSGLCLLLLDLVICLTTSVLLVIGANKVEALLWVGIVVLAFGMAPIFPAVIAWIEHYLPITNRIASVFILGTALGEMTIPLIIQRFINQEPMVLMYVNVIVNILCLVTFIALWFLASHQGEKYKTKIDRTMYQLANFDDVEDGYELCFTNSRWQNDYNSHILLERKLVGKTT